MSDNKIIMIMMKAKCGHVEEKIYSDAHHGLCRKCHSNFAFLLELEQKYGEDALIEHWYAKILAYSSSERTENVACISGPFDRFLSGAFNRFPSKEKYIRKMLFMLYSLQEPVDIETLK